MTDNRHGDWIQTFTGAQFYPLDPRPEDVFINDIIHHLALVNRFSGATTEPYSVAEHSVRVSQYIAEIGGSLQDQKCGLLHDASEAYIADVTRPVKRSLDMLSYRVIEERLMRCIMTKFGLPSLSEPTIVRLADDTLLATEKRDLLHHQLPWLPLPWLPLLPNPLPARIVPMDWADAEWEFRGLAKKLGLS